MKRRAVRSFITLFFLLAAAASFLFVKNNENLEKTLAMLSVVAASVSGYLAIAKKEEQPRTHANKVLILLRKIWSSDEKTALALLQFAVIFQAFATLASTIKGTAAAICTYLGIH